MQPRTYFQQLKSTGSEVVTIDPTSSALKATFKLDNIDARLGAEWCYGQKIRLWCRTTIDQPASGGAIIRPDQLYRMISSIKLSCDDLGQIYGDGDMNGSQLGLIAQIISNGYRPPMQLRSDIPAADGDTAVEIPIDIPLGHQCFKKGHQTGIWNGFFKNNGILEVNFAASTWPAAVSTGAASKATTDVRAELIYTAEPEARPPVIWHWRQRDQPVGETKHTIKNLCQGSGIKNAMGIGKVAFLAYLADINGLGGADGVDNITRVYPRDRGQPSHNLSTPFFGTASLMAQFIHETRHMGVFPIGQGAAYPLALGTTIDGRPNVASALFLPYFWPSLRDGGQEVSKCQEVSGDYYIEHDYVAVPAGAAKFFALEQSYLTRAHVDFLTGERMGLPPGYFERHAKIDKRNDPGDARGLETQLQKYRGIPEKLRIRK